LSELAELGLQTLHPFDELTRALDRRRGVGAAERRHQSVKERAFRIHLPEGVGTHERLDAPHACTDRSLVQDLDQ
jgi:hypothetical protein